MSRLYLDSAYIAKCYLHEAESEGVRKLVAGASEICSSAICTAEVSVVFHRHVRELKLTPAEANRLRDRYLSDARQNWMLLPVSIRVLGHIEGTFRTVPPGIFLRAGDVIHLATAALEGCRNMDNRPAHAGGGTSFRNGWPERLAVGRRRSVCDGWLKRVWRTPVLT